MNKRFQLVTDYSPCGDQPQAIAELVEGLEKNKKSQVLLGITGSGKTYTMANVIAKTQMPTLILAHNKTLAAQLYQEFKHFFPHNAVEYFVSYYDYYQPEAYIARTDTYIEKDMAINDKIDKMRLSATRSLLERDDVIIIASISCIYGLGSPEYYREMNMTLKKGSEVRRDDTLLHLVQMQYKRNDYDFSRGTFRVRGDVLEIFPAYEEDIAFRIEFFGNEIEKISLIDPLTGKSSEKLETITIYPGSHHVTPEEVRYDAIMTIRAEMEERAAFFENNNQLIEKQRILERTKYDMEMIKEVGFCKGIENYSRHFSKRSPGDPPPCLLDYFPKKFLMIVDESHQTVPQIHAMFNGDKARKQSLVDFGFRLPSAYDNRPLKFEEWERLVHQVVYVSATPGFWEIQQVGGKVIEQLIRPTGLLDPPIDVRKADGQIDDALHEIHQEILRGGRVLVTTITKKLSEELTKYLQELDVKAKYLHSDIETIERMQILRDLRAGVFDVLVGINLLREGLDLPEVTLVVILDADKQGFLRSETSLIQTCGRAARNERGRVIMYANVMTDSIKKTIAITEKRRILQQTYNEQHGIVPKTVFRAVSPLIAELEEDKEIIYKELERPAKTIAEEKHHYFTKAELDKKISELEKEMKKAAKELRFEDAAHARDQMRHFQQLAIDLG